MLTKVQAWQPPSSDHAGFKDFMIEQLTKSIEFDCDLSYHTDNPPQLLTGEQYLGSKIAKSLKSIAYHKKEQLAEEERTEGRNRWIKQLRESLL